MNDLLATNSKPTSGGKGPDGRLFFLDLGAGRILSVNPDGTDLKPVLVEGYGQHPDGVAVDAERGHIYWTMTVHSSAATSTAKTLRSLFRRAEPTRQSS